MSADHDAAIKAAQDWDTCESWFLYDTDEDAMRNLARAYLELRAHQKGCVERWRAEAKEESDFADSTWDAGYCAAQNICADELESKP